MRKSASKMPSRTGESPSSGYSELYTDMTAPRLARYTPVPSTYTVWLKALRRAPFGSTNALKVLLVSIIPCPSGSSIKGWLFASRATACTMSGLEKSVPVSTTATTIPLPVAPYSWARAAPVTSPKLAACWGAAPSWCDDSRMSRMPCGLKAPSSTTICPSMM